MVVKNIETLLTTILLLIKNNTVHVYICLICPFHKYLFLFCFVFSLLGFRKHSEHDKSQIGVLGKIVIPVKVIVVHILSKTKNNKFSN